MKAIRRRACAILASVSGLALVGAASAAPFIEKGAYATAARASEPARFEVFLPLRNTGALDDLLGRQQDSTSADFHKWLTPAQFKARFGPSPDSMRRTIAGLRALGFTVSAEHTRSVEVTGDAGAVSRAFSTTLLHVQPQVGVARLVANTPLAIPAALKAEGAMVVAFSRRPPHQHFSVRVPMRNPDNRNSVHGPYWFDDLKQAYDYPSLSDDLQRPYA